jgi:hypothetical protein
MEIVNQIGEQLGMFCYGKPCQENSEGLEIDKESPTFLQSTFSITYITQSNYREKYKEF